MYGEVGGKVGGRGASKGAGEHHERVEMGLARLYSKSEKKRKARHGGMWVRIPSVRREIVSHVLREEAIRGVSTSYTPRE